MAGKFKYIDPNLLASPMPGEMREQTYTDPVKKAIGILSTENPLPQATTPDEVMSNINQIRNVGNLMREIPTQQMMYGKTPEEVSQMMTREQPGLATRAFETVTKPFRWETSVTTAPLVALMEAMRTAPLGDWMETFKTIYPQMQAEALMGDREISVYDALRRYGMSNWGAVPLGIGADILLSPSTYLGIGGLTKLGRAAQIAGLAEKAGEVIAPASKMGAQIAELTGKYGPDALKLGSTMGEQANLGQRALVKFMGKPIIKGEGVFDLLGETGNLLRNQPEIYNLLSKFSTRIAPPGMDQKQWGELMDLMRVRRNQIGVRSKDFLEKELGPLAQKYNLTPDEIEEIWAVMQRQYGGATELPWQKLDVTEAAEPTMLSALRAKYPGLIPNVQSLDKKAFEQMAKTHGITPKGDAFTVGKLGDETTTYVLRDRSLSKASQQSLESALQGVQEGRQVFSVLPEKTIEKVKAAYGHTGPTTPDLVEKFGADWEKFISGNDFGLSKEFKRLASGVYEKEGGHLLVPGVKDVTMPDGTIRRVVGDMRFINQEQEAVRQFVKDQFNKLIQEEQGLGILNKSVEDYVPGIYTFKGTPFRGGKQFSTKPWFTKEKQFANPAQAEAAGYEPVKDILELLGIRAHTSFKAQESAKLMDEAAQLFGIPVREPLKMSNADWAKLGKAGVDPENYTQLTTYLRKNGYSPLDLGKGKEYWFQSEITDALSRSIKPFTSNEEVAAFWRMYDGSLNVWKGYVTSVNPKFHIRNMISNNYLLWLKDGAQGINPIRHKMAADILTGKAGQIVTDTGKAISYDDIRRMIEETGLKGAGFMSGEMGAAFRSELKDVLGQGSVAQKINPLSAKNVVIQKGRQFGTAVENEAKVVGFLNDLMKHGDPMEAAKNTYKYLYDYMDLTDFERHVAKRLIPFWTWMSKNIPNMLQNLATQPGKIGSTIGKVPMVFEHKTKAELRDRNIPYQKDIEPSFVREQGMFPVDVDSEGKVAYYMPGIPTSDLAKLGIEDIASGLTPALKAPFEFIPRGGYSMFMDRPYETYAGQMVDAPIGVGALPQSLQELLGARTGQFGTYMPGETAALINTLLPMLRTPTKLKEAIRAPEKAKYILPSELLGQKAIPIDPAMERRAALEEWLRNISTGKKVERGLERKEGRRQVEQMRREDLNLEDLIRLKELHYGKGWKK